MTGLSRDRSYKFRRPVAAALVVVLALFDAAGQAAARGPDGIADIADKVMDAVVNISTSQKVEAQANMPQLPPGSPFEEFFEEFFKNRRGQQGPGQGPGQ
ncbi:MAG: serine protease, partial [Rhodoplanes sp.]